jgi:hypothetical protein
VVLFLSLGPAAPRNHCWDKVVIIRKKVEAAYAGRPEDWDMEEILREHIRGLERELRDRTPASKAEVNDIQDRLAKIEAALERIERVLNHAPLAPSAEPMRAVRPPKTFQSH